jgi:hypothetical protein
MHDSFRQIQVDQFLATHFCAVNETFAPNDFPKTPPLDPAARTEINGRLVYHLGAVFKNGPDPQPWHNGADHPTYRTSGIHQTRFHGSNFCGLSTDHVDGIDTNYPSNPMASERFQRFLGGHPLNFPAGHEFGADIFLNSHASHPVGRGT